MTTKTKSLEKSNKPEATPAHEHAARQGNSFPQSANGLFGFQAGAGNLAVQRLLQSRVIQAKLAINQPGDEYEQEADRVAEQVMRMVDIEASGVSNAPAHAQRKCAACASGHSLCSECEEETIQRKPLASTITPFIQRRTQKQPGKNPEVNSQTAAKINTMRGNGQPLADASRSFFEQRFGYDFSQVRVHSDTSAAEAARSLNARAFTIGKDVTFGDGQYSPETDEGKKLLAHELTHVVQQRKDVGPFIQRHPDKNEVDWRPGMRAKVRVRSLEGEWDWDEIVEITSRPWRDGPSFYVNAKRVYWREGSTKPREPHPINVEYLEFIYTTSQQEMDLRPGMWVKLVNPMGHPQEFGYSPPFKVGDILELISGPHYFSGDEPSFFAFAVRPPMPGGGRDTTPYSVMVSMIEPIATPNLLQQQDQAAFNVNVLTAADFARATGIDPTSLPEGAMIPLNQARANAQSPDDQWLYGAAPGVGLGWAQAPWPAFPIPGNATGVQWTQSAFGHFSQFSNVLGNPVIGGYRSWGLIHGYQGLHSKITGQPWTTPVPGRYFNDWWFRLMSPESQTLVYRQGTPQHGELVARLIEQGRYTEPYTFPPSASGTKCTNCITVPQSQMYGALGGKPVIVTETGVYDITELGRPSPQDPFTVEQAGRGTTMREWLTRPTVQAPGGEIDTLNVAQVRPSTVWGARGVACIRAGGVILLIYGAYKTTERLEEAAGTPYFERVVAQETGSWVGGIIGSALGAAGAGAIACSPSGPGAFACAAAGFAGALIVGAAGSVLGSIGGDYVADAIESFRILGDTPRLIEASLWMFGSPEERRDYYEMREIMTGEPPPWEGF